jgi:hypothetical protein
MTREFEVDVNKLNKGNLAFIDKQGFLYPSDEIIINTPEKIKGFDFIISEMTQDELLDRMAVFTALYSSVSVNEALSMTEVVGYERELEIKKGQVMQLSSQSKITDKRQEALINDDVISLQEKLTVAESRLKLLSALRISYEKYVQLFSRGLTVQIEEHKLQ